MASMEFEADFANQDEVNMAVETAQQELQGVCYRNFEAEATKALVIKVQQDLKGFRFYTADSGEKYPSVTSITGYDKEFWVKEADLPIYCAQGNIYDAEIRNFVKTGVFKPSSELLECTADRYILKNRITEAGKHLSMEPCAFVAFLEKYPIQDLVSIEEPVFNDDKRFAGTPDLLGTYNGLKTLVSIKRTKSPTDNFIQEAGYSLCKNKKVDLTDVKQFMVVEMKHEEDGGNKQGFSKPSVTTEVERYRELFLRKRSDFFKIYGV